jgi:GNAT superfamily N-acetyltransferase
MIRRRVESGATWLAYDGTALLGAIALSDEPPHYIDRPAGEPEIYISGFITARSSRARVAGPALLAHAKATARRANVGLLRLDCYAGGDGGLVAYYESVGFRQVARFTVDVLGAPYTGCLMEQRLTPARPPRRSRTLAPIKDLFM